jgi:hypothetical protein
MCVCLSVCCECLILKGTGLSDRPILRPEGVPTVCVCVCVCFIECDQVHQKPSTPKMVGRKRSEKERNILYSICKDTRCHNEVAVASNLLSVTNVCLHEVPYAKQEE